MGCSWQQQPKAVPGLAPMFVRHVLPETAFMHHDVLGCDPPQGFRLVAQVGKASFPGSIVAVLVNHARHHLQDIPQAPFHPVRLVQQGVHELGVNDHVAPAANLGQRQAQGQFSHIAIRGLPHHGCGQLLLLGQCGVEPVARLFRRKQGKFPGFPPDKLFSSVAGFAGKSPVDGDDAAGGVVHNNDGDVKTLKDRGKQLWRDRIVCGVTHND